MASQEYAHNNDQEYTSLKTDLLKSTYRFHVL